MVATLLRLRLATTVHQLRREWWRRLVLVAAVVWALSLLPAIRWAAWRLQWESIEVRSDVMVTLLLVAAVGWVTVPVLITGLDDSLEPGRFAMFGVSARRLMPGLTVSAFLTIPALFFLVSFLMLASSWSRRGGPAVVAVAMLGALLAVATLVLSARLAVAWSSRLLQSRRSRTVAFASMGAFIASTAPVVYLLVAEGLDSLLQYEAANILDFLGVIPAGAPVRAAAEASYGNMAGAAWRLGVSAAWVALLHGAWRANVAHTLVHPVFRGGGARRGADEVLLSAEKAARRGEAPPEGTPAAAALHAQVLRTVRSRALRYWFTDPRYLVALVSVAVFPALFFVLLVPVFGSPTWLIVAVPVLLAGTIGWGRHNDVAHDSTALWMDVVSGRVGRPVMAGRLRASLVWSLPLVLAVAVGAVAIAGRFDLLPGVVGAALGVLGTTLGVSSLTSVALPYRAPAPGESPFAAEVGSVGASLFAQIVSSLAAWAVALPVAFPLVAALRWHAGWGWLGLVLGTAVGTAAAVLGTRWAGSLYDARSGRLLTAVT